MKRAFVVFLLVCVVALGWLAYQFLTIRFDAKSVVVRADPAPTPLSVKAAPTIMAGNAVYTYSFARVATGSAITLIPNFNGKRDAQSLVNDNSCRHAINGGFYDTSAHPLGFFYTDNRTYGQRITSNLVNGFFWADTNGDAIISSYLPRTAYRFAIQTGPLILFNGQTIPLSIQGDEHARRMIVAKTADDTFVFLAVYSEDSVYSGPLLADLPSAVDAISTKEKLGIAEALNLDGGSASAFYTGETTLSELTPVGSIFCSK